MVLDKTNIYDLPFHDSELLELNIKYHENGDVDLFISSEFDYSELDSEMLQIFSNNNKVSILFKDCRWLDLDMFCNRDSQELFDYIDIIDNSIKISELNLDKEIFNHISIVFISGSKLNCVVREIIIRNK